MTGTQPPELEEALASAPGGPNSRTTPSADAGGGTPPSTYSKYAGASPSALTMATCAQKSDSPTASAQAPARRRDRGPEGEIHRADPKFAS